MARQCDLPLVCKWKSMVGCQSYTWYWKANTLPKMFFFEFFWKCSSICSKDWLLCKLKNGSVISVTFPQKCAFCLQQSIWTTETNCSMSKYGRGGSRKCSCETWGSTEGGNSMHILNHLLYDVQRQAQRVPSDCKPKRYLCEPPKIFLNVILFHHFPLFSVSVSVLRFSEDFLCCSFHTPLCDFVNGKKSFRAQ